MRIHNEVYNREDFGEPYPDGKPWVFEFGVDGNLFFSTETEACKAQRIWRSTNNLHPITGEAK